MQSDLNTFPLFRGITFNRERDEARLLNQHTRVFDLMKDGQWRTLAQIAAATGDPEASVSARLRGVRASGYTVERRFVSKGLHEYRVVV